MRAFAIVIDITGFIGLRRTIKLLGSMTQIF